MWRFLFWALSIKIPRESISNPAIHIGAPDELSFALEGTPLLGFIDILGLASKFLAIYSMIAAESYSESAITAIGFIVKAILYKIKLGDNYTCASYICSKGNLKQEEA